MMLRTQGTHRLSSNALVKKGTTSAKKTSTEKRKDTGPFIFHADAIYTIHYEKTPIQIYRKFHVQKLKIFR